MQKSHLIRKGGVILPIFLFFIILLSISVLGVDSYTQIGGDNQDFRLGTGFWNSARTDDCLTGEITCSIASISSADFMPLVADLDNDGTNEIVVVDGLNIRLYQDSDLSIVDSYINNGTPTNIILFDIDGDNYTEIILSDDDTIDIIEYNGTNIYEQAEFSIHEGFTDTMAIQCRGVNDCASIGHEYNGFNSMIAEGFNSTGVFSVNDVILADSDFCSFVDGTNDNPLHTMSVADLNNDGTEEYVFSVGEYVAPGPRLRVAGFSLNTTHGTQIFDYSTSVYGPATGNCNAMSAYTSPLVYDIDGSSGNGKEIVFAFMNTATTFKIYSLSSTGAFMDDYPEATSGEGSLLSNVVMVNAFESRPGSDAVDFCVMGYLPEQNQLVCGSEIPGQLQEHEIFNYDTTGITYNSSAGYELMIHSADMDSELENGKNLDEITSSYGVFRLDHVTGDNNLELLWENPKGESVLYNIDVEKSGVDDLLIMTSSHLWYIDDNFVNANAEVSRYRTNPSIEFTIRTNETIHVELYCTDDESDNVQGSITGYLGHSNEQFSGWSSSFVSGQSISLTFEANVTIGAGTLRLSCRDINHNISDNVSVSFSVSNNGIQFGDAIYDSGDIVEETAEEEAETELEEQVEGFFSGFGLDLNSAGKAVIWLILMLYAGVVLGSHNVNPAGILVGEMGMLLIGSMIGFVPGWISAVVAISSLGLGMIYLFGNRGNGVS